MAGFTDSDVVQHGCALAGLDDSLTGQLLALRDRAMSGGNPDLLRLLAVLLAIPQMERAYAEQGFPAETLKLTLSDIKIWSDHNRRTRGGPGLSPRILGWMKNHLQCRLFRIGRLQFRHKIFANPIQVFLHPVTGKTLAIEEDSGKPILPWGKYVSDEKRIDLSGWERVLKPGDGVLDLHIPEDGPLTMDPVRSSLKAGLAFFKRYFPKLSVRAMVCFSWFFDPAFPDILAPESNLLRFMRLFYCFPLESHHSEILWRVFGREDIDPATAPRTTSLQRAVLGHLERGGLFQESGGFICIREITGPSAQDYWDALPEELKP